MSSDMAGAIRISGFLLLAHFAAAFVAITAAGAGHGIYLPSILLFPYSVLALAAGQEFVIALVVAIFQLFLYSVIFSVAASKEKLRAAVYGIAACHLLVATVVVGIAIRHGDIPLLVP